MKTIVIVTTKDEGPYYSEIIESVKELGVESYQVTWEENELEKLVDKYMLQPSETLFYMRAAGLRVGNNMKRFQSRGFAVVNSPKTLKLTSNKYLNFTRASRFGIPVADTYIYNTTSVEKVRLCAEKLSKAVIKPLKSPGKARYVSLITKTTLNDVPKILSDIPSKKVLVQKYIEHTKLIRVVVLGGKVIADSVTYKINKSDRIYSPDNRKVYLYENVPDSLIELSQKTAEVFESDICFADFFETSEGEYIFNEVNTASGFSRHDRVLQVPMHRYIARYLVSYFAH